MVAAIARVVRGVSLGIWLGSLVMTFIAANQVFFHSGLERPLAGHVMGGILHAGGVLKLILAALAIAAHFASNEPTAPPKRCRRFGYVSLLLATALALIAVFYFEPELLKLRAQFDTVPEARAEFGKLHGMSMGAATLETVLVTAALICALI